MAQTSRRKNPYPVATDTPDVVRDVQALAQALDDAPKDGQGPRGARPTTNLVSGQRYYATDERVEYRYDGTSWNIMGDDPSQWRPVFEASGLIASGVGNDGAWTTGTVLWLGHGGVSEDTWPVGTGASLPVIYPWFGGDHSMTGRTNQMLLTAKVSTGWNTPYQGTVAVRCQQVIEMTTQPNGTPTWGGGTVYGSATASLVNTGDTADAIFTIPGNTQFLGLSVLLDATMANQSYIAVHAWLSEHYI